MTSKFLTSLLNTTIVTLSRVINVDGDVSICLSNTIVLTTSKGQVFEILLNIPEDRVEMCEIFSDTDLVAGFEREPDETLWCQDLQVTEPGLPFTTPFYIHSITEVWQQFNTKYGPCRGLQAIVFQDVRKKPVLGLIRAADEIWIGSLEEVQKHIGQMTLIPSTVYTETIHYTV